MNSKILSYKIPNKLYFIFGIYLYLVFNGLGSVTGEFLSGYKDGIPALTPLSVLMLPFKA